MLIHINILLLLVFPWLNIQQPREKNNMKKTAKEIPMSKVTKTLTYYIVFEPGKTELSKDMKEKLDGICKVFRSNPGDTLDISSGSEKNKFYKERSVSVNNYLISKGIPQAQIRFVEFGKIRAAREIQLILKE
jgi:outer membrane protein OmpA-like peptidoglycan-associated protein